MDGMQQQQKKLVNCVNGFLLRLRSLPQQHPNLHILRHSPASMNE